MSEHSSSNLTVSQNETSRKMYQFIMRWHFFCALVFIPLILIISLSGCIYLFEDEYEKFVYEDLLYVQPAVGTKILPASTLLTKAQAVVPEMKAVNFNSYQDAERSTEVIFKADTMGKMEQTSLEWAGDGPEKVEMVMNEVLTSIYINPYTGEILGQVNSSDRFMGFMKDLHGNLLTGKFGTKFVELTACWIMVLMTTGLILWWPKNKIEGVFTPRLKINKRIFWRDLHAISAFYFSFFIIFLVLSGLPWTDVWGEGFRSIQRELNMNAPPAFLSNEVKSRYFMGAEEISIDQVISEAKRRGYQGELNITIPQKILDTYAIQQNSDDPADRPFVHLDQYTGKVLASDDWNNVPLLAKSVSYGIKLHRGEYFGVLNLILVLLTALVLIFMAVSGLIMWLQRKPDGKLGAPVSPKNFKKPNWIIGTTIGYSLFMPLLGASLIVFFLADWLYRKYSVV